jgi:hypothetical protein
MKHRTSEYPLGKLLLRLLASSGLSLHSFALSIGYGNPNKGIRAFDDMLREGYPNDVFLTRLLSSKFSPGREVVQAATNKTLAILSNREELEKLVKLARERAEFRPFFQAVPETRRPSSISIFVFTGGASRYTRYLPASFSSWPQKEQYQYIKQQIINHFSASGGTTLLQGRITAYRLFHSYGLPPLLLSVNGEPLGTDSGLPLPEAQVAVGQRRLCAAGAQRLFTSGLRHRG